MQRIAFKMQLKPGYKDEYKKRHSALWPELKSLLKENGIHEYSIFLDEETLTLFAVQHIDGTGTSQDLGQSPVVQRWWAYMADLMETNPDFSPVSKPLEEVFYLP